VNIIGLDQLVFGVLDFDGAVSMAHDFGLNLAEEGPGYKVFEALDGTSMKIVHWEDPSLPAANASAPNIREAVYGVQDQATLDALKAELSKDRVVTVDDKGALHTVDDDDYAIAFQITVRHATGAKHYGINVPGQEPGRGANIIAAADEDRPKAHTLSHLVLFVHDKVKAEKFYADRLGFRTVDVFTNLGPFMRPAACADHHTLFLIEVPFRGAEHFAFHVAGANELLKLGWELTQKGYKSSWGPGRHILGSNYFWYFHSPFGCKWELDADMDLHDDNWQPRYFEAKAPTSQIFHFKAAAKYQPGGPDDH
jgi:catechol 2,3-dioxygenase-like lactoylglutathione lyase family enzyme